MAQKKNRAKRPSTILLTTLVIVLSAALCAVGIFLCSMLFSDPPVLTVEAGDPLPAAADFFPDSQKKVSYITDVSAISMNIPGEYPLSLSKGNWKRSAVLKVVDTKAPTASVSDVTVVSPGTVTADDFVSNIQDATDVSVSFAEQPDLTLPGTQQLTLVLTDLGGNETLLSANVTVVHDTEAPKIMGVKDILTYVGSTVAYRSGVSVSDDCDSSVTLELDSSKVDLSTAGVYTVTYSATDASGNTATKQAQVNVLEKQANHVEVDVIYAAVDALLAKFITDDMTDRQKAEAIYVWTYKHMTYGGHTDTTDYIQSAYQFLTSHKGDCYGYFALQKLMFERLNIPTIDVRKVKTSPKDSNHYWLMVSIDGGETYYHFDNVWSYHLCLVTDAYLDDFSARPSVRNAFNRDKSLYPATPTEQLPNVNELPWNDPVILKARP